MKFWKSEKFDTELISFLDELKMISSIASEIRKHIRRKRDKLLDKYPFCKFKVHTITAEPKVKAMTFGLEGGNGFHTIKIILVESVEVHWNKQIWKLADPANTPESIAERIVKSQIMEYTKFEFK